MLYEIKHKLISMAHHPSFDFVPHAHHNLELYLCSEGECEVSCNFRTERLHPGQAMIAFPNDVHSYSGAIKGKGWMIIVSPSLLGDFLPDVAKERYTNFVLDEMPELLGLAAALHGEYRGDQSMEVMVGYLHVIIGTLTKHLTRKVQDAPTSLTQLSRVLQYLSAHFHEHITLRETGRRFGISEAHLSRTFTQRLGCSFVQYLHMLRIERAEWLLRTSGMRISQIALDVGFADIRSFNRVFRELRGITPSQYRTAQKKDDG